MEIACAACGSAQAPGARFCSSCGAALFLVCPQCGQEQQAAAAFCSACGFALRPDPARLAPVTDRQERRVVTVLFADLAGSTALGERLDPEDVRELQARLFDLVNSEVERFGGVTEKFVGDAILAVFGIPRAHEDDAERAIRTALAAQEAFASLAKDVEARFDVRLGLRVGVNTGEVVAGREAAARGELMVSGDAVNTAARLQQAAEPGEVLVGARTRLATARSVVFGAQRPVEAKGKSKAIEAWPAKSASAAPSPRGVGGLSAPLVARAEEMAILTAVARRVERERTPQLVTLFGAAGVGKSRLLGELVARLSDAETLVGRCLPYGEEITYWPVAEAVKAHASVLDTDAGAIAREKLRGDVEAIVGPDVNRVLEPILWTIGLDLPGAGLTADEVAQRVLDAWRRYLVGLGTRGPTILAIEDVHWASPQVLDLLERLAETLADVPVLLVCTARTELLETRPTWGAGKSNATALTLAPLAPEDAADLLEALLGAGDQLGAFGDRVLERAEGNPFFVEEMLEMLIERGVLVRSEGRWWPAAELADVPLPDSVHGVIAARIDLLDAEPREALRRCSVIGRVFWPEAAGTSEDAIVPLTLSGLVSELPTSSMAGLREFAFKHALTRDVAYASLPRAERRALHLLVARWIQDVAPDRGVEAAELAAYHYSESLEYGEAEEAVAERAGELFLTVGQTALRRGSLETAKRNLDRALELSPQDRVRAAAQIGLGELEVMQGGASSESLARSRARLDKAIELAGDDVRLESEARAWLSRIFWLSGEWELALHAANRAVAALEGLPESPQLARALARRSQLAMLRDATDAEPLTLAALEVAERVGDPFAIVNARINVMTSRAFTGAAPDPEEVLALIDRARAIGANEEAFRALVNFVWSACGYVPVDQILRTQAAGQALLEGVSPPAGLDTYLPISIALMHHLPAGRFDEIDRILPAEPDMNATSWIAGLAVRGLLDLRRGVLDEAAQHVENLRPAALESGEPQRIIPMLCAFLPWALVTGRQDELRTVAAESLELIGPRWSLTITALPAARALAAAGETELLQRYSEAWLRAKDQPATTRLANTDFAARGLLALAAGSGDEAAALLTEAATANRALGYDFDAAAIELDLARALDAGGETARAASLRADAEAFMAARGVVHPF